MKRRLQEKARNRRRARDFAQQSVDPKRKAERESHPGQPAETEGQVTDCAAREQHRDELRAGQAFAQKNRAQEHIHERRHEIAKTCLEHVPGIHRPDENKPVDRDRDAAAGAEKRCATGAQVGEHFRPAPLPAQEQNHEDTSPDKAMRENLRRGDKAQELPINGHEPPGYERRDARDKRGRFMRIACQGRF